MCVTKNHSNTNLFPHQELETKPQYDIARFILTRTPMSACAVPLIMLGTNPACPGASRIVKRFLSVSNAARPTSTVLPYSNRKD